MTKDIKDFNVASTLGSAVFGGNIVSSSFWGATSGTALNLSFNGLEIIILYQRPIQNQYLRIH